MNADRHKLPHKLSIFHASVPLSYYPKASTLLWVTPKKPEEGVSLVQRDRSPKVPFSASAPSSPMLRIAPDGGRACRDGAVRVCFDIFGSRLTLAGISACYLAVGLLLFLTPALHELDKPHG